MKSRNQAVGNAGREEFDLCVIGGGATGAGCALDAQLRGLKTILLEAGDFASATSSASTKIIHGGVRYLQEAVTRLDLHQYRVVRRALGERIRMLENAPFLSRSSEFLVPCFRGFDVLYYGAGLKIYDWMAGKDLLSPSRYLSRKTTFQRLPALKQDGLRGAIVYQDGQFDDARYGICLLQSFAAAGGEALNYARLVGLGKDSRGRLVAADVRDELSQRQLTVRARAFVNATGPFSDSVRHLATPGTPPRIRLSKGVHILLPLEDFSEGHGLLVPKTADGRVLFALPWNGRLLVGTTDTEASLEDELVLKRDEAEYLLCSVNAYLAKPFRLDQVVSGMAGLRPLVSAGHSRETKNLVRDDEVELDRQSGLISILGGKWTTYRAMAEDTINAVQKYLGGPVTDCPTRHYPLAGSRGYTPGYWQAFARQHRLSPQTARHLVGKFGTDAAQILTIAAQDSDLSEPLLEGFPYIQAEVVFVVRCEMASTLEDVLARRIGLQLFSWRDAIRAAPRVGALMARELAWSAGFRDAAVDQYVARIGHLAEAAGIAVATREALPSPQAS
jgi:glycerol-3-phosphate dehydrogenase